MAIISVEIPDKMVKQMKPFSIIKFETLVSDYLENQEDIEFDFRKENIDQNEFLSYLKSKHG